MWYDDDACKISAPINFLLHDLIAAHGEPASDNSYTIFFCRERRFLRRDSTNACHVGPS